jgi:eukaryotic-like serine/threonine-protein kinase
VRLAAPNKRLPALECVRIGLALCEALDFLHGERLTHRDIKPQNIVFVGGRPKLADVGLIAEIRQDPREGTMVGTVGYMVMPPEPPGTVQADIYALGMVLYVIWTGREPDHFPQISTTLALKGEVDEFLKFNAVILKACQPVVERRFQSAREMAEALRELEAFLKQAPPA